MLNDGSMTMFDRIYLGQDRLLLRVARLGDFIPVSFLFPFLSENAGRLVYAARTQEGEGGAGGGGAFDCSVKKTETPSRPIVSFYTQQRLRCAVFR